MRWLRWTLAVAAVAGCADLTGLSQLEVGDATAPVEASTEAGDASPPESGATDDGAFVDVVAPKSYCQGLSAGSYFFCADFDEGDVTHGYASGVAANWTTAVGVSLDKTSFVSGPASARLAASTQPHYFSEDVPAQPAVISIEAQLQLISTTASHATVLTVQTDTSHYVSMVLVQEQNSVSVHVEEIDLTATDGGGDIVHVTGIPLPTTPWAFLRLGVSPSLVAYTIGTTSNSFTRATYDFTAPAASLLLGSDWTGLVDDVVVRTN